MSDQPNIHLTRKRQRDEENKLPFKQQKSTEANSYPTKLTDVNHDCLEKVFLLLSFEDLLNVAHTNTKLIPAAELAFSYRFGKKKFFIPRPKSQVLASMIYEDSVHLFGLKLQLRVLRSFGHLISNLVIMYGNHHYDKIVLYANRYGFESLTEIIFGNMTNGIFKYFEKPFVKAKTIRFSNCTLKENSASMNTWFPKMRSLIFYSIDVEPEYFEINFPHLKQLKMIGSIPISKTVNFLGFLRSNPQLRTLILNTDHTPQFLCCVLQNLQLLERLEIQWYDKNFGSDVFKLERLKRLEIDFHKCSVEEVPVIPILSDQLEEFTWIFRTNMTDNNLIDFFKKHTSIITLNMRYLSIGVLNGFKGNTSKMAEALPLLQEVEFDNISLSTEDVIPFIYDCESLKMIRFKMLDRSEFVHLMEHLNDQWKLSKNGCNVTLKRKV